MRYFLGVHRFTPVLGMIGDTGWIPSVYRRWLTMIRYWNKLVQMDDHRITKKVFIADYNSHTEKNNWTQDLKKILSTIGLANNFENKTVVNLSQAKDQIHLYYANKWSQDIQHVPKLRTYRLFKSAFKTEEYIELNLKKNERSMLCQLRMGILPLRVETGRFVGEPLEQRTCRLCHADSIEDEVHFLFECDTYNDLRHIHLADISPELTNHNSISKLNILMSLCPQKLAKLIVKAYLKRRTVIYA